MTVQDLIDILQEMPKDLPVMANYSDIENVYINDEHYFGDSANPNCEVGKAVEII